MPVPVIPSMYRMRGKSPTLCDRLGVQAPTIYGWIKAKRFPQGLSLSGKSGGARVWPSHVIDAWLAERAAAANGGTSEGQAE